MVRGLYASADGMLVQMLRGDVIAGNLAGVSVPAFRREVPSVSAFERTLAQTLGGSAAGTTGPGLLLEASTATDRRSGAIRQTGLPFDLAIEGEGLLAVETPEGVRYTRGGAFRLDAQRRLVTAEGALLLGESGPIVVSGDLEIRENGEVFVDGVRADALLPVEFPPEARLHRLGGGLLLAEGAEPVPAMDARVRQGALESANVNTVSEMVAMIATLRAFEASQRALQASDDTLNTAINEIGRV